MPAPQAMQMQTFAKTCFRNFGIKIPIDWREPEPMHHQLEPGNPGDLAAAAMWLFKPATTAAYHVEAAKTKSREFESFIDGICSAICAAWSSWQTAASMVGVMIAGPVASMGTVLGIPWTPLIIAQGPNSKPQETKYTRTIATVIGTGWQSYQSTIQIPGLPWYPAFSAFPLAFAGPLPNVPCPVATLTQVTVSISKDTLKQQMVSQHGDPQAEHHEELFESIADGFDKCFKIWQGATQVTNVMGMGPVPTFVPPVPVPGPVVGGVGLMAPGGFV